MERVRRPFGSSDRWRRLALVLTVVAMTTGAGACSDGDGGGDRDGAATTTSTEPTTTTTEPIERDYEVVVEADPGLPGHTVYRPKDLAAVDGPLPVVTWGNGACINNGKTFERYLTRVARKGYLIISNGPPDGAEGSTSSQMLLDAIDWAEAENDRAGGPYDGRLDTDAIAVMGQSCGGLEAIAASSDPRVTSTAVINSGIFPNGLLGVGKDALTRLHGPTIWITGGPSDIAYANAVDDYANVPDSVPSVLAHFGDVGHVGGFAEDRIDEYARVGAAWLDATLRGSDEAGAELVGPDCNLCSGTEWTVESKHFPEPEAD